MLANSPAQISLTTTGTGAATLSANGGLNIPTPNLSAYVPTTVTVNGHALSANVTIAPADLVLTGYVSGTGTISATDNVLQAIQKLNGNAALYAPLAGATFTGQVQLTGASSGVVLNVHGVTTPYIGTTDAQPLMFCTNNNNAQFGLLANGSVVIGVTSGGGNSYLGFSSSYVGAGTVDIQLSRQGAGILSQRGGTQAQEFQTFGTYTDSTHSAKLFQGRYDTNYHYIGTEGNTASGSGGGLKIQVSNPSGVAGDAIIINTQRQCTFPNLTTGSYIKVTQTFVLPSNGANYFGIRQPSGTQGSLGYGNSINLGTDVLTWDDSNQVGLIDGGNVILGTTTGTQIGTAASQKLSLWGKKPIVQPTTSITAAAFFAGTSGVSNDSATWGGYTIGQLVQACKNFGLVA